MIVTVWELALVHRLPGSRPASRSTGSTIAGAGRCSSWPDVGISGLARLARRGHVVPAAWFAGCLGLGLLGAVGLPIPVWYRFLLLCQIPLAIGVAAVLAGAGGDENDSRIVLATFSLASASRSRR